MQEGTLKKKKKRGEGGWLKLELELELELAMLLPHYLPTASKVGVGCYLNFEY